jgi:arsenite methyltransferase
MKEYLHESIDFRKIADYLDELPLWSAPFGLKLLEKIWYRKGITALDIGFGNGFPLLEIALRLGESSRVYGIDPWKEAIIRVKKKADVYGLHHISLIEGEAESIPLERGSIDLITSNNGINNVADISMVFAECSRVIKPGGQFVQSMNLDMSMFEFYNQLEQALAERNLFDEIETMHRHIYEKRKPLDEIITLLEKNGFAICDLQHDQFNYYFADASALFRHYFIRLAFIDAWKIIVPDKLRDSIFNQIETNLNRLQQVTHKLSLSIPFVVINAIKQ